MGIGLKQPNYNWVIPLIFVGAIMLGLIAKEPEKPGSSNHNTSPALTALKTGNELSSFPCAKGQSISPIDGGKCADQDFSHLDSKHEDFQEGQRSRDEAAKISSYLPTNLRVDTDIDAFWLKDEERICQTYPNQDGRVAVVACTPNGSHRNHNIPITFWGGVDRNAITDWKCRREDDNFVCRAID
jgi:hypothetical protein